MRCRHAAELISLELDGDLSLAQWAGLGVHTFLCPACRRFRWQLAAMHESVEQFYATSEAGNRDEILSSTSKAHLKAAIVFHLSGLP